MFVICEFEITRDEVVKVKLFFGKINAENILKKKMISFAQTFIKFFLQVVICTKGLNRVRVCDV